ncbi:hypothetical protein ACT4US_34105, partial [Bacillus sp. HC-Mk]
MKISFSSLHPFVNFFYYIGVMILCTMCLHPLFLIGAIVLIIMLNVMQGNGEKKTIVLGSIFLIFSPFPCITFNIIINTMYDVSSSSFFNWSNSIN